MGLLNWIVGLGRRGSNAPLSFNEWLATPPPKIAAAINRHLDRQIDRDPGPVNRPVPPRLPDDLADLPVMPAEILDGAAAAPAPAEMPSDELLNQWVQEARRVHTASGYHIKASTTMARLAIAWARQQQAQSPQLPPPGADPLATTENLWDLWASVFWADGGAGHPDARRAIYARGRADERTAIFKALGVQP